MNWTRALPWTPLFFPLTALADVAPGGCRCDLASATLASATLAPSVVVVAIALVAFCRR